MSTIRPLNLSENYYAAANTKMDPNAAGAGSIFTFSDDEPKKPEQKVDYKKNIENAIKDGSLEYTPEEKFLFGLITRKAEYTYKMHSRESIEDVCKKFNLKPRAIFVSNGVRPEADWAPPKGGATVYFYEEDIIKD